MLNEARRCVKTCPGMGRGVTTPGTPGTSCNVHDLGHLLYTCIIIIQGYYGTFREDFSIFKILSLTPK